MASPSRPPGSWTGYPKVGAPDSANYNTALQGMAKVGNPRIPMGQSALQSDVQPVLKGKLRKKGDASGGSDANLGRAVVKPHVMANEHNGPRFGIRVKMPAQIQEVTTPYSNGRIVPGVMGQRNAGFDDSLRNYGANGVM